VGDDPDHLPILQHALMRTWESWAHDRRNGEPIDLRHYEDVGTMTDALLASRDEAFAELPNERSRGLAEKIFKSLTEKVRTIGKFAGRRKSVKSPPSLNQVRRK
jgi:hypothetical protein